MQKDPPQLIETALPGVFLLTPTRYTDDRGFFTELYNEETFAELGIATTFVQDSVSFSKKHVVRGLHFQVAPHAQSKLVRCAHGRILDVAVDVRKDSPTFGKSVAVELDGETQQMLYIPGEYAHGFMVLSDGALVSYKLSGSQVSEAARGVRYNDPKLDIAWPVIEPILSLKDQLWDLL